MLNHLELLFSVQVSKLKYFLEIYLKLKFLDNISLQLNQSVQKTSNIINLRQPLKHPKMRLKVAQQNRFQAPPIEISVSKKQGNNNEQVMRHQQILKQNQENANVEKVKNEVIINDSQKQKALKFREKQLAEDLVSRRMKFKQKGGAMNNNFEAQNNENFNDIINKISIMELPRGFKDELVSVKN